MTRLRIEARPGATLIELLVFLAVLSIVVGAALPILFSATENRLLQQTIAVVEQNGAHVVQNTALKIRQAERIVSPPIGATGSVLVLHTSSGSLNPTIIGMNSGSIVLIQHSILELVSSEQVAIQHFEVRNVSASDTRQSVLVSFDISRTIRLQQPYSYGRRFEFVVNLLPDDVTFEDECGCIEPACVGNDTYEWRVCEESSCLTGTTQLECP